MSKVQKEKNKQLINKAKQAGLFNISPPEHNNSPSMGSTLAILESARKYLEPLDDGEILITEEQQLIEYIDVCIENGVDALDTETTGLDPFTCKLAGVCIYTPGLQTAYIPINHVDFKNPNKLLDNQLSIEFVKEQLLRIKDNKHIYHTAKFDMKIFKVNFGIDLEPYWDCFIAEFFVNPDGRKGLKYLYENHILETFVDNSKNYSAIFGKEIPFTYVPLDIARIYAGGDSYKTYKVFEYQYPIIKKDKQLFNVFKYIEMPLINIVVAMELQGIDIDVDFATELSEKYHKKLEIIKEKITEITKEYNVSQINLSSPSQLKELLCNMMNVLPSNSGTGEEFLKKINHPIGQLLLEYREVEKLLGTYIDKFPKSLNKKTNKIHADFKQLGTDTGRFACSDPNLLNIPSKNKEVRQMFIPPKGYVWIGADISKQEPAIFAQMAKEKTLLKSYATGEDIYVDLASKLYKVEPDECRETYSDGSKNIEGAKKRSNAKQLLLGMMYGMGAKKLADSMNLDINNAKKIISDFKATYPDIENFIMSSEEMVINKGYVTTICGRRRYLSDIHLEPYEISGEVSDSIALSIIDDLEDLKWEREKQKEYIIRAQKRYNITIKSNGAFIAQAKRQAVNSRIQGSAADTTKLAMIKMYNNKELQDLGYKIIIQIYDEIVGICPIDNKDRVTELISKCMIEAPKKVLPDVTFGVDVEITDRWYGESVK